MKEMDDMNYSSKQGESRLKAMLMVVVGGGIISLLLCWAIIANFDRVHETALWFKSKAELKATAQRIGLDKLGSYQQAVQKELQAIDKKLDAFQPVGTYIIINTAGNDFILMQDGKSIREGMCSTGSYTVLKGNDKQQWIFKTPRGMFKILNKIKDPVWKKPDWAFVEEGMKVPSANHPSRYEYGVLGDYAMALGQGYLIHGTLYKRYLGMPVTHGCVRMGDEDLEAVFKALKIGSKVYIY